MNKQKLKNWLNSEIEEIENSKIGFFTGLPEILEKKRKLEMLKFTIKILEKAEVL